jgi:2-polyprenyl-3-methyl-5-hydroxy-6-metoxy-1,4-benzoquinol methylase
MPVSKYDVAVEVARAPDTSHAYMIELVGSNKRVLDVGCATGYLAEALGGNGNVVSGVEYDRAAAEKARPHLDRLVIGDLEALDLVKEFGEATFDAVVFGDVLEHLRDPLPVLRQARPLLKAGGSVVISVPNIAHGDIRLSLLNGRFDYTNTGLLDETHLHFFTRESLGRFLKDAGFLLVDIRRTTAKLFTTEAGLQEADYPPDLVEQVRSSPESQTYQFVVRAVRDDAAHVEAEVLERLEVFSLRVARLEEELRASRAEREALAQEVERREDVSQQLTEQARMAARYRDELEALRRTKIMRMTKVPRAVWSGLRRSR